MHSPVLLNCDCSPYWALRSFEHHRRNPNLGSDVFFVYDAIKQLLFGVALKRTSIVLSEHDHLVTLDVTEVNFAIGHHFLK